MTAVGRARLTRRDLPGHPLRGERPFRLLVDGPDGEQVMVADYVLDASGVYGQPAALGAGGIPAPGERGLNGQVIRDLGPLDERLHGPARPRRPSRRARAFRGQRARRVRIAGRAAPSVTWATRSAQRRPCVEVASDPLPERERVTARANDMAEAPPPFLKVERRASVESISARSGRLTVALTGGRGGMFDAVVALTGYRPDLSFLSELALEIVAVERGGGAAHPRPRQRDRLPVRPRGRRARPRLGRARLPPHRGQELRPPAHLPDAGGNRPARDHRSTRWRRRVSAAAARLPRLPESPLLALDTLWLQVAGTVCNLQCTHCFISCSPANTATG